MDPLLTLVGGALAGLVLGGVIGWLLARSRRASGAGADDPAVLAMRHEAELDRARAAAAAAVAEQREAAMRTAAMLQAELAAAEAGMAAMREQIGLQQEQFRELSARTEREHAERRAHDATESKVLQNLAPVQESLRVMQSKIVELEGQRSQQHGEISQQLRTATEAEERLRYTAEKLAAALGNNATRGVWGETQLRSLVESAGLINRVDFTLQETIESDSGSRRPDLVLRLPGGKSIAVDAKVPYNDYIEASAIPATADGEQEARRTALLAAHAKKVKAHVDALSAKSYWSGLDSSPEFTIAFIPNEPLLAAALGQDPGLLEYAFSKRIALASPVSLWSVLKTIAFTWQQDVLTEDAKQLFVLGKELYGRLATLADHADKLRGAIQTTVDRYNTFASSLEQRVLVTARKLDALDESKVITAPRSIDAQPKSLTQTEFGLPASEE